MRKTLAGLALLVSLVPAGLQGQSLTVGPTVAYGDDLDIGAGVTVSAPFRSLGERVEFAGDFLLFFPDGPVDYFEFNGNLTYDFDIEGSAVVPFLLGGLNIARASLESVGTDESRTDLGLNIGGGIDFDWGEFRPTLGVKLEIEGGDDLVVFFTLPFALGVN